MLGKFCSFAAMKTDGLIVGIGEVLWDMLPEGPQIGGAPANFAYHVTQFGMPGCIVSAVGRDDLGKGIIGSLAEKGIDCEIAEVDYPTGTVAVTLDAAGVPQYDIACDVAWDNIPFGSRLAELAQGAAAVCFGSMAQRSEMSRLTIRRFLDALPADALIVFDINLRQHFYDRAIIEDSLRRCNVLKINDEELEIVGRMFGYGHDGDFRESCRRLLDDFGLRMVILTCGANGSYLFSRDEESFMPTPVVDVADTVGAGDSFTAAFIASLLQGRSMAEAHAKAVETSAFVCSRKGAMPELPDAVTRG